LALPGRLLVGTSTGSSVFDSVTPQLQVEGTSYNNSSASLFANTNDANGAYLIIGKSRGTSTGSSTIVNSNDAIGGLIFIGADGTDRNTPAAHIFAFADGTPGANDMPGRLVFSTTADGASSPTERMRIDASSQWDDLKALQVRNYNFKPETGYNTHTQIGLVAQEVELVSPGLVTESPDRDEDGNDLGTVTKSVNYSVLYMKAVKALQEAMERIETLEQRLNDAGIN
jgi:hypothetical protein